MEGTAVSGLLIDDVQIVFIEEQTVSSFSAGLPHIKRLPTGWWRNKGPDPLAREGGCHIVAAVTGFFAFGHVLIRALAIKT